MVSYFFFKERPKPAQNKWQRSFQQVTGLHKKKLIKEFEGFIEKKNFIIDRDKYLIDGEFCMDGIIRYEHLLEDVAHICEIIDVPFDAARFPKLKTNIRDRGIPLKDFYSPKSIQMVADAYQYELEKFNYDFPG